MLICVDITSCERATRLSGRGWDAYVRKEGILGVGKYMPLRLIEKRRLLLQKFCLKHFLFKFYMLESPLDIYVHCAAKRGLMQG